MCCFLNQTGQFSGSGAHWAKSANLLAGSGELTLECNVSTAPPNEEGGGGLTLECNVNPPPPWEQGGCELTLHSNVKAALPGTVACDWEVEQK